MLEVIQQQTSANKPAGQDYAPFWDLMTGRLPGDKNAAIALSGKSTSDNAPSWLKKSRGFPEWFGKVLSLDFGFNSVCWF